jgi:hypothetical protein
VKTQSDSDFSFGAKVCGATQFVAPAICPETPGFVRGPAESRWAHRASPFPHPSVLLLI